MRRLSLLLACGREETADALTLRLLRRAGPWHAREPAMLDRLVIQEARGVPGLDRPAVPADIPGPAAELLGHLAKLPRQSREAWLLSRVDGVDELWMSRAMDCSRTAAARYLAAADEHLRAQQPKPGALEASLDSLRAWLDGQPIADHAVRTRQLLRLQKRRRLAMIIIWLTILSLGLAWAALRLLGQQTP